jgi:hypothetical protein
LEKAWIWIFAVLPTVFLTLAVTAKQIQDFKTHLWLNVMKNPICSEEVLIPVTFIFKVMAA